MMHRSGYSASLIYIFSILSMPMFHMAGHSVQRMWTGFGVRSPYNLRMVMVMVIWNRNHAKWETVGSSRMPPVTVKAAAAAAISLGHATC